MSIADIGQMVTEPEGLSLGVQACAVIDLNTVPGRIPGVQIRSLALPGAATVVVAVVALILAPHRSAAPSQNAAAVTSRSSHITVPISNYAYKPASLTVHAGTRITWTNHDATAHTATADQGSFDTGTLNADKGRTIDFARPGTYSYHCAFHAFMTATITVVR